MENFSTVLWIVVIAAAMIFNVVSQSRKQAKKQARQAGDRHAGSEAWPSWDPAAGPQPDSREDLQPVLPMCRHDRPKTEQNYKLHYKQSEHLLRQADRPLFCNIQCFFTRCFRINNRSIFRKPHFKQRIIITFHDVF